MPIVFIHLGAAPPPDHMRDALEQARVWNPDAPILLLSPSPVVGGTPDSIEWVDTASIPRTMELAAFQEGTGLDQCFRGGFWRFTTERLFFLEAWMRWKGVGACIHLENDIMVYADLNQILERGGIRREGGPKLLAPVHYWDADGVNSMCYSILVCLQRESLQGFLQTFLCQLKSDKSEMVRGGEYWEENPEECATLPVVPPGTQYHSDSAAAKAALEGGAEAFGGLFDAAAHGQFLGGQDPRNGECKPGFVNLDANYGTYQFVYSWETDAAGQRYPLLEGSDGRRWRIWNLHIHCKDLAKFRSVGGQV